MKGLSHVFTWEVTRHLRNKQFLIGLLLTPLIFVAFSDSDLARVLRPAATVQYLVVDELVSSTCERSQRAALLTPHSMDPGAAGEGPQATSTGTSS